jgi:TonB family protein
MEFVTNATTAVTPVGDATEGRTNALQTSNHNFMLRIQAAIGPKHLDGGGLQGRVLVAFSVSDQGQLTGMRLAQSSGIDRLDQMAMQIVGKAAFPTPPIGMPVTRRTYISAFTFG